MKDLQLKVMQWFWFVPDRVMDKHEWAQEDKWDWAWNAFDFVQDKVVARALCGLNGHRPERDHCGRPEHDFCLYCHKSMPNEAKGGTP